MQIKGEKGVGNKILIYWIAMLRSWHCSEMPNLSGHCIPNNGLKDPGANPTTFEFTATTPALL
jgi:hypothetical protein